MAEATAQPMGVPGGKLAAKLQTLINPATLQLNVLLESGSTGTRFLAALLLAILAAFPSLSKRAATLYVLVMTAVVAIARKLQLRSEAWCVRSDARSSGKEYDTIAVVVHLSEERKDRVMMDG